MTTTYLAKFNDEGRRIATYLKKGATEEQITAWLNDGFIEIDSDTFNLLLGNVDGKEHIRDPETGTYEKVYTPTYTAEQIAAQQEAKIEYMTKQYLDETAKGYGYDSCLSACSYVDTGVQQFDEEGAAFRVWRSSVWMAAYKVLDDVQSALRTMPEYEDYVKELPEFSMS